MEKAYTKTITSAADFDIHMRRQEVLLPKYSLSNVGASDVTIVFTEDLTDEEITMLDEWVELYTDPTPAQKIKEHLLDNVDGFVRQMKLDFLAANIEGDITGAGKTKDVADYLRNLNYYLDNYSLTVAIQEIDALIAATVPADLAPFVTQTVLEAKKAEIEAFLAV